MDSDGIRRQCYAPDCSVMCLELGESEGKLEFQDEYILNSLPLRSDFLIIRKRDGAVIDNEIGKIFRGHNILEYAPPGSDLNIRTYFEMSGYACLYKVGGPVDDIREDDITLTLAQEEYPRELMRYFRKCGYKIENKYPGIYYVSGCMFPLQVVELRKLDRQRHPWLTSLTRNMEKDQAETLVNEVGRLSQEADRKDAECVLDLAMNANPELFDKIKDEYPMSEALMKLKKPELDAAVDAAKEKKKRMQRRMQPGKNAP